MVFFVLLLMCSSVFVYTENLFLVWLCACLSMYVLVIKWEIWDENRFFSLLSRPSFCLIGNEFSTLCLLSGYTSLFQFETRKWEAKKNMHNYWTLGFDFRDRDTGLCERKLIVFLFCLWKWNWLNSWIYTISLKSNSERNWMWDRDENVGLKLLLFKLKTCN